MGILRVLLASAVVAAHADPILGLTFTGGRAAVQTFYMISGFYMALILSKKYVGPGSYKLFISNRLMRLLPTYWVVLVLTILAGLLMLMVTGNPGPLRAYIEHSSSLNIFGWIAILGSNLMMLGQDALLFFGIDPASGNFFFHPRLSAPEIPVYAFMLLPQAWTVGLELLFYLIAPFLVRRHFAVLMSLLSASLFLRVYIYAQFGWDHPPWDFRFFPTELAFFLAGILAYRVYTHLNWERIPKEVPRIVTAFVLFMTIIYQHQLGEATRQWFYYVFVFCALPFIFACTKNIAFDRKIGELSYPVYISHLLVLMGVHFVFNQLQYDLTWAVGEVAVICSLIFSWILAYYILEPVEVWRQKRWQAYKNGVQFSAL